MSAGAPAPEPWAANPDLDDVDAVELAEVPGLGGLYARGIARSATFAGSRETTVGPSSLPQTHLVVRGVRADADRLTAYQHLVGEPGTDVLPAGFVHVMAFPVATALMVARGSGLIGRCRLDAPRESRALVGPAARRSKQSVCEVARGVAYGPRRSWGVVPPGQPSSTMW